MCSGLITMAVTFSMNFIGDKKLKDKGKTLNWLFTVLFPNHAMIRALMDISSNYGFTKECEKNNYTITCLTSPGSCCREYGELNCDLKRHSTPV